MPPPPPLIRRSRDEEGDRDGVRVDFDGPEREHVSTIPSPTDVEGLMKEDGGDSSVAALDSDVGEGRDCLPISARSKGRCRRSTGMLEEEDETWSQHEHWRVPGFLKSRGGVSVEDVEDLPPLAMEVGRVLYIIGYCPQPRYES